MHGRSLWLPFSDAPLFLSSCPAHYRPTTSLPQQVNPGTHQDRRLKVKMIPLYTPSSQLLNLPFRELNRVSREDYQPTKSNRADKLNIAGKLLPLHAVAMKTNALRIALGKISALHRQCHPQSGYHGPTLLTNL